MTGLLRAFGVTVLLGALLYLALFWFLKNPILAPAKSEAAHRADPARLESDVRFLASIDPARNARNTEALNRAAAHIEQAFAAAGCAVEVQAYVVNDREYKNIICSFGQAQAPRLVIGAHYDVSGDLNPGADDNASGVAGVLELARLIGAAAPKLTHRLDLVAFTLEEPPHFHRETMGSYVYARHLSASRVPVTLMIAVEMIGYFSDRPGSQTFPFGFLSWFYPDQGNFIAVVGSAAERKGVARVKELMARTPDLPVYSINAPSFVPGIDFSDHWSFWQFGFPAVMVTDTAFYRNPNYHEPTDTPETLDYRRMALTVDGLYQAAIDF